MESQTPPLQLLFQDQWLIAVDKPAGQLVHPADTPQEGDLVTMKILRDQISSQVEALHRLDRPTSGVLLFASDKRAAKKMRQAFEKRHVSKTYWAVVNGCPTQEKWSCSEPIQKTPDAAPRSACTHFRVLRPLRHNLSIIEATPETGRYHQIRRHLLHAGHPIVGDYLYAGIQHCDTLGEKLGIGTRMLLQAKSLSFDHPMTGEHTTIEAPTVWEIQKLL